MTISGAKPETRPVGSLRSEGHASKLLVRGGRPEGEYVLIRSPGGLGIMASTRRSWAGAPAAAIRWAPWELVSLRADPDPASATSSPSLIVYVGQEAFQPLLEGAAGRTALERFSLAVERIRRQGGYADYDAASMLAS